MIREEDDQSRADIAQCDPLYGQNPRQEKPFPSALFQANAEDVEEPHRDDFQEKVLLHSPTPVRRKQPHFETLRDTVRGSSSRSPLRQIYITLERNQECPQTKSVRADTHRTQIFALTFQTTPWQLRKKYSSRGLWQCQLKHASRERALAHEGGGNSFELAQS